MDHHTSRSLVMLSIFAFIKYLQYSSNQKDKKLKEKKIEDSAHFHELGMKNMKLRLYDKAIDYFNKALDLNPIDLYYNNRAVAYLKADKFDKAIEDYNYLLAYNKNNGSYYFGRGVVYFYMENYDLAKLDFENSSNLGFELAKDYLKKYYETTPAFINDEEPINHNIYMQEPKSRDYKRLLYSKNKPLSYCQTFYYSNQSHFSLFLN